LILWNAGDCLRMKRTSRVRLRLFYICLLSYEATQTADLDTLGCC
jgi:hypothetical protein